MKRYEEVFLWNDKVPFFDAEHAKNAEHFMDSNGDGIERLTDVSKPSITYYPVSGKGPHPAVLVCPGGGYGILAWNHEGIDICTMLNSIGYSAFLLKYRCPDQRLAAHADASRALRLIRARATEFNIRPDRLGILGFSAGGHLTATMAAPANKVAYEPVDDIDKFSDRPDFAALIYPAYLCDENLNLKPEFKIAADMPPCFMIQAEDDGILVENSLAWFWAMKKVNVPAEMHCYAKGGHGYGILPYANSISQWPKLLEKWLKTF